MEAPDPGEPTIKVGSDRVKSGSFVRIPVTLNNPYNLFALQFDVAFEPSLFSEVDTTECLLELPLGDYLAGCRRQDPPNQDIVRFVIFRFDFEPIPPGVLGNIGFRAADDAPSGVSPLAPLECSGLGIGQHQQSVALDADDFVAGEIIVEGTHPAPPPSDPRPNLDLDGTPVAGDDPVVRLRLDIPNPIPALDAGPREVLVTLPGGRQVDATMERFIPRDGYVERLNCSGNSVPDSDPGTPVSFRFYGELSNGGWLGLTVVDDVARGTLVTDEVGYQIHGEPEAGYRIDEIDQLRLPPTDAEAYARSEKSGHNHRGQEPQIDPKLVEQGSGDVVLDMLIMYTAQAQIDAGGPAGLDALIQQSIDSTNQAFINSGYANLSVREVHRELLTGFVPSGNTVDDAINDLDALRINSQILAARDNHHADVTSILLRDFFNDQGVQELGACGIAYLQSPTCGRPGVFPQCGVGMNFEGFATNWVSTECANLPGRNSFPHELGHLMGAEHQPGSVSQDPTDASFVWSFAHLAPGGSSFGTLMWVPNPNELPQPLNFSNPDVLIQGQATGIVDQRDNTRTIELLTPTMEQYRFPPPEPLFADRFESP